MDNVTIARADMLAVADAVAREKLIDRELVLEAMEQAIQKAGRSKYGTEHDIRANIDRKTGEIQLARYIEVVEPAELENEITQILLEDARKKKSDIEVGDFLVDRLPPIDFGRIAAQTAKQVIVQRVQDAERERQYEEYKERSGQIINGIVKRVEFGSVTVDLGRAEGYLRRDEIIPREKFNRGDRIRAYITQVKRETKGPQILLSRTRPEFMGMLFFQEVPEIYDGTIEIKRVARDPGSRAKIAVLAHDPTIDPVGACVGIRGSRVQAVVNELQGEKIDIIPWTEDQAQLVIAALAPATVSKVVMDEDRNHMDVIVATGEDQSKAIGRFGQNVRLASMLTGWNLDILTEDEASERREQEAQEITAKFIEVLDVDDVVARLLVTEGFSNIEEVAYIEENELAQIEGFDPEIAQELQLRATSYLTQLNEQMNEKLNSLNMSDQLKDIDGISVEMLIALGENDVQSLEDFAGLTTDELLSNEDGIWKNFDLDAEDLDQLIIDCRVQLGWIEPEPEPDSDIIDADEQSDQA